MIKLTNVKLKIGQSESLLYSMAEKRLGKKPVYFKILKKSLDARDKNDISFIYSLEFSDKQEIQKEPLEKLPKSKLPEKPVLIVGSGPAGLFCALKLIERGIIPYVIERGDAVEEREKKTNEFALHGVLDMESNIQFGEGGAGTFSDGKLNTQTHGGHISEVQETFVKFGAPEEIQWLSKPHIGSDNLKHVVRNMREYIISQGGKVEFNTKLTDIIVKDGKVVAVEIYRQKQKKTEVIDVSEVVLAIGHSARDTFYMLSGRGVEMQKKDFAIGVRIEHLQKNIGFSQYGKAYELLPTADYKLVSHTPERSAFTFCMCPGGFVMPSASEEGGVVTNGMSNYRRDGVNANSALISQVRAEDIKGNSALSGIEFQREIEQKAFTVAGKNYYAPCQLVGDFLKKKCSSGFKEVLPTYPIGTAFVETDEVLPKFICDALRFAITDMGRKLKGFDTESAILTAPETRTSSPVKIERGDDLVSVSTKNLYPCGEGAGYSGGITSSASDGIRVAEAIYKKYNS